MIFDTTARTLLAGTPYDYAFTVFTATYNRARTLPAVFESLRKQTFQNFEWIIVDDGSTDHTSSLVAAWQRDTTLPIQYLQQSNSGKHVAYNRAGSRARGQLFLTVDSDDFCSVYALERFLSHWLAIPTEERRQFSGVTCLCQDPAGRVIGERFPRDVIDSDAITMHYWLGISGDKGGLHRTDVMREFPFPVIAGEKFLSEGIVWNRIAAKYKMRFVNEALITCEYRPDGLTAKSLRNRVRDCVGATMYYREALRLDVPFMVRARNAINVVRFGVHSKTPLTDVVRDAHGWLVLLLAPLGYLKALSDRALLAIRK